MFCDFHAAASSRSMTARNGSSARAAEGSRTRVAISQNQRGIGRNPGRGRPMVGRVSAWVGEVEDSRRNERMPADFRESSPPLRGGLLFQPLHFEFVAGAGRG